MRTNVYLRGLLLAAVLISLLFSSPGFGTNNSSPQPRLDPAAKIEQRLQQDLAGGKSASFIIVLDAQADLSPAYAMTNQDARGWYVYNTLKAEAARSQPALTSLLASEGVAYQSFWAANAIVVNSGDAGLVSRLAARSDVRRLEANRTFSAIDPIERTPLSSDSSDSRQPAAIEWGVQNVNAPQVWALGYRGQGIVIAGEDTGIRWTHNTLKAKYRGWNGTTANHNYNWHDAIHTGGGGCGPDSLVPCDDTDHGTHTVGSIVGDDGAGNQIGVAPDAKWIGCRNMDVGNGNPATYTECIQWMIAPTDLAGNNPNPTLRPHVINNSWGCPPSEGCAPLTLETIIGNAQASGIFFEASAGNGGPNCATVSDPPANYAASFSTGAININNGLASFSSRGPGISTNLLKPDLSAPGVNVRSATNSSDTAYVNLSGTSMAGPHVVGVVALLWSAHPELARNITATKNILLQTANPVVVLNPVQTCGGTSSSQIPNNSFGYGRVDALAAVNSVPFGTPTSTVTGTPPTATSTSLPATATTTRTATTTPTATATSTVTSIATATSTAASATATLTGTAVATATATLTGTAVATATATLTGTAVTTATATLTSTASPPTATATLTGTPAATATPCAIRFSDVPTSNLFYGDIQYLACRGIVSGANGLFSPNANASRGQFAKIATLGFAIPAFTPTVQTFVDVAPASIFYGYIEAAFHAGVVNGLTASQCAALGTPGTCYAPNVSISRAQVAVIVQRAKQYSLFTPTVQTFSDVPVGNFAYAAIETLAHNNIINGAACGTSLCFRPNDNIKRGELSKVVRRAIETAP